MRCGRIGSVSQVAVAVGLACRALSLPAGDDMVSEPAGPPTAETVRFQGGNVRLMGLANGRLSVDLGTTFDQQVFGRVAAGGRAVILVNGVVLQRQRPAQAAGDTLEKLAGVRARGEARIAALDRVCGLDPDQRQRLELALASDLQRLAVRIDAVRRKYVGREFSPAPGGIDREAVAALRADAMTCRRWLDDPFGSESLLSAVVDEVAVVEQATTIKSLLKRRESRGVMP